MKISPLFTTYLNIIYWIPIVYASTTKANVGKSDVKKLSNFATSTNHSLIKIYKKIQDYKNDYDECAIINW